MTKIRFPCSAWRVQLRAGKLLRDKWIKTPVKVGQLIKDEDGRFFRVIAAEKLVDVPAMRLGVVTVITKLVPAVSLEVQTN